MLRAMKSYSVDDVGMTGMRLPVTRASENDGLVRSAAGSEPDQSTPRPQVRIVEVGMLGDPQPSQTGTAVNRHEPPLTLTVHPLGGSMASTWIEVEGEGPRGESGDFHAPPRVHGGGVTLPGSRLPSRS